MIRSLVKQGITASTPSSPASAAASASSSPHVPVSYTHLRQAITASYFLYNYAVTVVICMLVLAVCVAYLCVSGGFFLTAADVCAAAGITLLSALSATMITVFAAGFLKTEAALSASGGILSAVIGFVIGAYMPISMFPLAVQRLILCVPGTYLSLIHIFRLP